MTKSDIFNLTFKLIGFYFLVLFFTNVIQLILVLINSLSADYGDGMWMMYGGMIINVILNFFLGYILVFKTERITKLLKIKSSTGTLKMAMDKRDLIELSLIVISVIAIVFSIPTILANITDIIYFPQNDEFGYSEKSFDSHSMTKVVQLALGIFLLLNARNFAKWINKRGIKDDEFDKNEQ